MDCFRFKSAKKCVANLQTQCALKYVVTIVDLVIRILAYHEKMHKVASICYRFLFT